MFNTSIPLNKTTKRHEASGDQIEELAKRNKAFSCSGNFQNMGNMLANTEEVTRVMKLSLEEKDKWDKAAANKQHALKKRRKDAACDACFKYTDLGELQMLRS